MKSKKILIIVIILIIVFAVIGTVLGYLYMTTDFLKNNKDLFAKYFNQNIDVIENMVHSNTYNTYEKLKNESTYESNLDVKLYNSKGGEISNPINKLSAKINTKKDNVNEYSYVDAQVLYNDTKYLEAELIRDKDVSGIRFSDVVKQFVTVRNDEKLSEVSESLEIDKKQLENCVKILNETESISNQFFNEEELELLKQKYINIIIENIQNATYSKQKKSVITVNNNTIETNAYSLILTKEQVEIIIIQILNNIKTDEIILNKVESISSQKEFVEYIDNLINNLSDYENINDLKVTVYEKDRITVRTLVEYGLNKFIFENYFENNQPKIKIQNSKINSEKVSEQVIEINKVNTEEQENLNVVINNLKGEENNTIQISYDMQINNDNANVKMELKYIEGIETTSVIINNETKIMNKLENKLELDSTNNVILNDLEKETRDATIKLLKDNVPEKIAIRLGLLAQALGILSGQQQAPDQMEMSQVDINRFNAKFEFYTGDSVSAENVKTLLEIVKTNIAGAEFTTSEDAENEEIEEAPIRIKMIIEKDKQNDELIKQISGKIQDRSKYKVLITYKDESNLIDYITITEIKD